MKIILNKKESEAIMGLIAEFGNTKGLIKTRASEAFGLASTSSQKNDGDSKSSNAPRLAILDAIKIEPQFDGLTLSETIITVDDEVLVDLAEFGAEGIDCIGMYIESLIRIGGFISKRSKNVKKYFEVKRDYLQANASSKLRTLLQTMNFYEWKMYDPKEELMIPFIGMAERIAKRWAISTNLTYMGIIFPDQDILSTHVVYGKLYTDGSIKWYTSNLENCTLTLLEEDSPQYDEVRSIIEAPVLGLAIGSGNLVMCGYTAAIDVYNRFVEYLANPGEDTDLLLLNNYLSGRK